MEAYLWAICLFSSYPLLYNGTRLAVSFSSTFLPVAFKFYTVHPMLFKCFMKGKKRRWKIGRQKYVYTFTHSYTITAAKTYHHYNECSVYVCMSVCVSVCTNGTLTDFPIAVKFIYMLEGFWQWVCACVGMCG